MKLPSIHNINRALVRHAEVPMALAIVCLVALLIIRVDQSVIDVLIALNIGISVTILLTAFYIPDAAKLPSFPTILLLTTLFRLALNVSTTRLILLEANAGKIINAFGNFVVEGNFIVGGVVFIVLVVIQFIVIAKGAERVAEVSARFTLDAMPGKQMAIDYDLNKGMDPAEGKRRREELQSESKLYSAMDGAMKFVKGDAIAGIIIAVVNILGGLAIGILQQGMSAGDALQVYSVLTIGDGLVSQIPALLISVSAGLVVTRVASTDSEGGSNIGRDIVNQILSHPKGLLTASGLMAVIGATGPITGLPMIPFLVLAVIGGTMSILRLREPAPVIQVGPDSAAQTRDKTDAAQRALSALRPTPLALELHDSLRTLFIPADAMAAAAQRKRLADLVDQTKLDLGIMLPHVELRVPQPTRLPAGGYSINVYDVSVGVGQLTPGLLLIPATLDRLARAGITPDKLTRAGITPTPATLPWNNAPGLAIPIAQNVAAISAGVQPLYPDQIIAVHLRHVLFRYGSDFLGVPEVARMLKDLEPEGEELINAVLKGTPPSLGLTLSQITDVLKILLREQVSIRNLPLILESLARWGRTQKDTGVLAELVRLDCRRAICAQLTIGPRVLTYHSLSPEVEHLILSHATPTPQGAVLGLRPQDQARIIDSIRASVAAGGAGRPVVVTTGPVRRLLRSVIEQRLPDVAVLSYDEMAPEFERRQLGSVSLAE